MMPQSHEERESREREIVRLLRLLVDPDAAVELRALNCALDYPRYTHIRNGFYNFEHLPKLVADALDLDGKASGIYFSMNPVRPDLLARRLNRCELAKKGDGSSDEDILRRRWMFIDADPTRPAGVSSTDAEKLAARETIDRVIAFLDASGFPPQILADSGNGFHLLVRIEMPADDGSVIVDCMRALAAKFDTPQVKIDINVASLSRHFRLYGTMNCKGDEIPTRPHRRSAIVSMPPDIQIVPEQLLHALAAQAPPKPEAGYIPAPANGGQSGPAAPAGGASEHEKLLRRAESYIATMPVSVEGSGGHNAAYAVACKLVRDFALSPGEAMPIMQRWNAACQPPWSDYDLQHKLDSAMNASGPRGTKVEARPPRDAHGTQPKRTKKQSTSTATATRKGFEGPPIASDDRQEIILHTREHEINDQAVAAIAGDEVIYQRTGSLVHVITGRLEQMDIERAEASPRIEPLPLAKLRERLTANIDFVTFKKTKDDEFAKIKAHPPAWCVLAVHARGEWPGIRPLQGVVSYPVLRPDGTILCEPGYDARTRLLYDSRIKIDVPDAPTLADAHDARDLLLDVVCDFPFESDEHRAGWFAFLLTPLCRYAFNGPSPLFLADGNVAGAGKSMLMSLAAMIVTGNDFARMPNAANDDEMRKRITAIVACGDPLVLIDNVSGNLGSASLDAALTGTVWKDRILGQSTIVEFPLNSTWAASGNNVMLVGDMGRRVVHVRLNSPLENPEEREGFKRPALEQYVRENRPKLLTAALTILRAYIAAGRPKQRAKPWGSFEGWSSIVRQSMLWVGLPDPGETRTELQSTADAAKQAWSVIIRAWHEVDPDDTGLTASEFLDKLEETVTAGYFNGAAPYRHKALRDAVMEWCPGQGGRMPSSKSIGNRLARVRLKPIGNLCIDASLNRAGSMSWRRIDANKRHAEAKHTPGSALSLFDDRPTQPTPVYAGSAGSAGSSTSPTREENRSISISHTLENDPANPANPADASTERDAFAVQHKSDTCDSLAWWTHIAGGVFCASCWPASNRDDVASSSDDFQP